MNMVELIFHLIPEGVVPVDHGHALFGAIKEAAPGLGTTTGLGIHPLRGRPIGEKGELVLDSRTARLRLRLPAEAIPDALALAGKSLRVHSCFLRVGVCSVSSLQPSESLWARTVTRKFDSCDNEAAKENLLQALAAAYPEVRFSVRRARTIRIHQKQILGFEVLAQGLSDEDSLRLQAEGFGGRRSFGCGIFVAVGSTPKHSGRAGSRTVKHGRP